MSKYSLLKAWPNDWTTNTEADSSTVRYILSRMWSFRFRHHMPFEVSTISRRKNKEMSIAYECWANMGLDTPLENPILPYNNRTSQTEILGRKKKIGFPFCICRITQFSELRWKFIAVDMRLTFLFWILIFPLYSRCKWIV